ncbi:MAG: sigma-70 family RNA polymerase sigma factor [Mediterranea massiliensis]|nr:sigma-70 family RNA polymerase sigma factor [Mediterranea massiliensis]
MSDIEEIYDDAIMAFYSNIKEGKLTELTCSIQTYINRIGTYKTLDFLKKHQLNFERIPDVETIDYCERTNEYWMTEGDSQEEERKNIIYSLIERLVEPCKKILFSFYYDHFSMEMIAQSMGFATPDVAKTQKSRCMAKVKKAAEIEFQNEGLI